MRLGELLVERGLVDARRGRPRARRAALARVRRPRRHADRTRRSPACSPPRSRAATAPCRCGSSTTARCSSPSATRRTSSTPTTSGSRSACRSGSASPPPTPSPPRSRGPTRQEIELDDDLIDDDLETMPAPRAMAPTSSTSQEAAASAPAIRQVNRRPPPRDRPRRLRRPLQPAEELGARPRARRRRPPRHPDACRSRCSRP